MSRQPHVRLWDANYNCIYNSKTDQRSVEQFLIDREIERRFSELAYTYDQGRTRRSGRLIKTADGQIQAHDDRGYLDKIMALPELDFNTPEV